VPSQGKPLANTPVQETSSGKSNDLPAMLRSHLAESLPDYMIPSVFVIVDAFPLTPNGKIDRKALPSPTAAAEPESSRSVAAPRNETEAKLVEIWKQVLGLKEVGIDCDIFD